MAIWIPWASLELRDYFNNLVARFGALTVEQADAVSSEPEDAVSEDEVV